MNAKGPAAPHPDPGSGTVARPGSEPRQTKRPSLDRGKRRVESLLAAAEKLFADEGYGAVSMNAIAREAGASAGSLYQFFPTKTAMAMTLIERYEEGITDCWRGLDVGRLAGDYVEFSRELLSTTLAVIDHQIAFSTLDEAHLSTAAHKEALALELAAVIGRFAPHSTSATRATVSIMLLQLLKAAYALNKSPLGAKLDPQEEFSVAIAGYLQHHLAG